MKIVKVSGGLGNQMFQYAFAKARGGVATLFDLSWFETATTDTPRLYALDKLNCSVQSISSDEVDRLTGKRKSRVPKIIRRLFHLPKYTGRVTREKAAGIYEPALLEKDGLIEGCFQSEKYFHAIREQLLKDFTPCEPLNAVNQKMLVHIKSVNAVSIHVRRGDYLNLTQKYGLCDLNYYQRAIAYIAERVSNPHFILFSDDIAWVRDNLKIDYPYTVVDINGVDNPFGDMWLMKQCQHNIIANSTFSWWGAWLNENPNKIVVAPVVWFTRDNAQFKDIIPDSWVKL